MNTVVFFQYHIWVTSPTNFFMHKKLYFSSTKKTKVEGVEYGEFEHGYRPSDGVTPSSIPVQKRERTNRRVIDTKVGEVSTSGTSHLVFL